MSGRTRHTVAVSFRRLLTTTATICVALLAILAGAFVPPSPAVHAAAPYTVAAAVSRGYSGGNVGLNNYTMRNLGAYAAVGTAGEALPVWCIQAQLGHSTAAGAYVVAPDRIVESGALDYLLWSYRSFDLLDASGDAHDRAAAINGLTLFYAGSPRNGNSLRVWADSRTGAAISPADSSGHRWSALPQFSLSFPIGMYDLGARNHDRAEQLTEELFHEAERLAAPWHLANVSADTVSLTAASGAPVGGHPVTLYDRAGELVGDAVTDAAGALTVTDPRVVTVRAAAPGTHIELSAGAGAQRLVGGGTPVELRAEVTVAWAPEVVTQISSQSALPFETVTDSIHVSGVPAGAEIAVELELYDIDDDPHGDGAPLAAAVIHAPADGWSHGHAPYTVRPDQQGARLSYHERWIDPTTGAHGPWSALGIAAETTTVGRLALTSEVLTPEVAAGTVVDRVGYPAGLAAAGRWELRGVAVTAAGEPTEATATVAFTPDAGGGSVDVELPIAGLAAGRYVIFQYLLLDGAPVAAHADLAAASQAFDVIVPEPTVATTPAAPPTTPAPSPPPASAPDTSQPDTTTPIPAPPVTAAPPDGDLPSTGNEVLSVLVAAAVLTVGGVALWSLAHHDGADRRHAENRWTSRRRVPTVDP